MILTEVKFFSETLTLGCAMHVLLPQRSLADALSPLDAIAAAPDSLPAVWAQVAKVMNSSNTEKMQPEQIESRQRLFDMGIDSLMAVELKNLLESSLGQTLSATLLFDYPTVEAIADYLKEGALSSAFPSKEAEAVSAHDELEGVSDDEIADLLARELMAIKEEKENK